MNPVLLNCQQSQNLRARMYHVIQAPLGDVSHMVMVYIPLCDGAGKVPPLCEPCKYFLRIQIGQSPSDSTVFFCRMW